MRELKRKAPAKPKPAKVISIKPTVSTSVDDLFAALDNAAKISYGNTEASQSGEANNQPQGEGETMDSIKATGKLSRGKWTYNVTMPDGTEESWKGDGRVTQQITGESMPENKPAGVVVNRQLSNGKPLTIGVDANGELAITVDGKPFNPEFGKRLAPVDEFAKSPRTAALHQQLKTLGASHLLGGQIPVYPTEYAALQDALKSHPENIRKRQEWDAEVNRLSSAERAENKRTAWQRDSAYGFSEGTDTPDRPDNTPTHKGDI